MYFYPEVEVLPLDATKWNQYLVEFVEIKLGCLVIVIKAISLRLASVSLGGKRMGATMYLAYLYTSCKQ